MKKNILLSTLLAMALFTGCGDKSPEIADETADTTVKTVQDETSKATTKENTTADSSTTLDANQDTKNTQTLDTVQDTIETQMQNVEGAMKSVYFDFDKFFIRGDMQTNIETNAAALNAQEALAFRIKIEGNCDEWGTDEYNYALGLKRADSSKKALLAQGVSEDRITLVSLGEANPKCTEKTQECWSENRRADFKVLP